MLKETVPVQLYWGKDLKSSTPWYGGFVNAVFYPFLQYGTSSSNLGSLNLSDHNISGDYTTGGILHYDLNGGETNALTIAKEVFSKKAYLSLLLQLQNDEKKNERKLVLDGGANIGTFCLYMGSQLSNTDFVAIEAVPRTREIFKANVLSTSKDKINPSNAVHVSSMGLQGVWKKDTSDIEEMMPCSTSFIHFVCQTSNSTSESSLDVKHDSMMKALADPNQKLFKHRFGASWPFLTSINSFLPSFLRSVVQRIGVAYLYRYMQYNVNLGSVKDIVKESGIDPNDDRKIDLLKLDTEGLELPILLDIPQSIWKRLQVVAVEIHDTREGELKNATATLKAGGLEEVWHLPDFEYNKRGANKHLLIAGRAGVLKDVVIENMKKEGFVKLD
ncbi:hypothetical protein CTEN210_17532 [Chaetoceros tenuissimus]|uniref:Methyltransferase FkbM domain-containing protein n=1 Tax=Chaetoceros tenuissimus TaxID=426638 RepID=A0AAD3DD19_9STRA|nr:hypothetical protein CTEN210_17532 [Chaetoceros tenuissimus]